MTVYLVHQGQTYQEEKNGRYLWSPQKNARGGDNAGYKLMVKVCRNDFILHSVNSKIVAISIARKDCYQRDQPTELRNAKKSIQWNNEGYYVETSEYHEFGIPFDAKGHKQWFAAHKASDSAFDKNGEGQQRYLCHLAREHSVFILEKAIKQNSSDKTLISREVPKTSLAIQK